ncbi:cytochrome P450 [Fomitiporia mediterranea MF3/22]|uniref:cytochrome P450 n=1 Tax=Fomitiporia mediterranea (strain MF3/22) TaxID=694068 RepID=UPI000440733D|nr:cytochrome P450 [Fomitiporia mediterranea MF3/22]EJD05111.1 cytochrome P450 [Fomitiporia mediterranea MF3/22]
MPKLPVRIPWVTYSKWRHQYGDVVYAYALGRSILILNSFAAARDLLEKKSATFSDRPYLPVFNMMGWELNLPFLRYGPRFRKHHQFMHQYFGPTAIDSLSPIQERETRKFLLRLLTEPDILVAGINLCITYGREVQSGHDELIELTENAMHLSTSLGNGAGAAPQCVISDLLDEYEGMSVVDYEHEKYIKSIGATVYNAGTHTTKATLTEFFLMMTLHPEVTKKAQEEIDRIVGTYRMPSFEDRKDLPYIECLLKELYRIHPPGPLGMPHITTQTEEYRSWVIPDGTIVISNIWQMMRDEAVFQKPGEFVPERFLNKTLSGEEDPSVIVFGFGRRVCPGKYLADTTLWLAIVSVLAMFDIEPYTNPATGEVELPKNEVQEEQLILELKPFKCKISPRSGRTSVIL